MLSKVNLMLDKTKQELGVDPFSLPASSATKVYVECSHCHEVFQRRWSDIWKLHSCPALAANADGVKVKQCGYCGKYLPIEQFAEDKTTGLASWCIPCMADKPRRSFDYWLHKHFVSKRSQCKKFNIAFNLDEDFLRKQWQNQDGKCYYSHINLKHSSALNGAILERLDPLGGYIIGNVVWCSRAMNSLKSNATHDEFKEFIASAIMHENIATRLEYAILHPDGQPPSKKRSTDAGHDISSIEEVTIQPNTMLDVHTGVAVSCPPGWYFTIEGRSGLFRRGIAPCHAIIDATYCGELQICLMNISNVPYKVQKGDRIAQMILHKSYDFDIVKVDDFGPEYNQRGLAGFGSSGR